MCCKLEPLSRSNHTYFSCSTLQGNHSSAMNTWKGYSRNHLSDNINNIYIKIIIIAFQGANRVYIYIYIYFLKISSMRRKLSPTRTLKRPGRNRVQITCNTSSAYHEQHVVLRSTWYEGTAQLLCLTEFKSHLMELFFERLNH